MTYRVICTYHPNIGTFRGKRGAWRVYDCYRAHPGHIPGAVNVIHLNDVSAPTKLLCVNSLKPRQKNSWCNPHKLLTEWQKAVRG